MRIVYDTEFVDDGVTIEPISIAMVRTEPSGSRAELYLITDSLPTLARAAESHWHRENTLKWLPIELEFTAGYGVVNAHVSWDEDHPDYSAVRSLDDWRNAIEDFVLHPGVLAPQLWADYSAYDHVLLAQLFGPMSELPEGFPMNTLDLQQELVMRGVSPGKLPELSDEIVQKRFGGVRQQHNALYDALEEEYQLTWLLNSNFSRTG